MKRKIFKAISLLAIGTIISRIFGLFREIVSANFLEQQKFMMHFLLPL